MAMVSFGLVLFQYPFDRIFADAKMPGKRSFFPAYGIHADDHLGYLIILNLFTCGFFSMVKQLEIFFRWTGDINRLSTAKKQG